MSDIIPRDKEVDTSSSNSDEEKEDSNKNDATTALVGQI